MRDHQRPAGTGSRTGVTAHRRTIGAVTTGAPHSTDGTDRPLVILKSPAYGARATPILPYRIDHLRSEGWELRWTDRNRSGRWATVANRTEARTVPWVQAWLTRRDRRDAVATVAMFESEAHGLALWRRVTRRRRPPLVVISCWLADLAAAGGRRRSLYRWLYGAVDAVVVFSANQVPTLVDTLGIPADRIHVARFGVDLDELSSAATTDAGTVVAVGRDLSRDWKTLAAAVGGTGWEVELMTRRRQVVDIELPPEVRFRDPGDRTAYLELLAAAAVVVVPTGVHQYPAGQTVLLEAMALGKACVVTDTPGIRDYVTDGVDAVLVPPHDPDSLRDAIGDLLDDPARRKAIGDAARQTSDEAGGAAAMWAGIATVLGRVTGGADR